MGCVLQLSNELQQDDVAPVYKPDRLIQSLFERIVRIFGWFLWEQDCGETFDEQQDVIIEDENNYDI
jgi:hypothetical protein